MRKKTKSQMRTRICKLAVRGSVAEYGVSVAEYGGSVAEYGGSVAEYGGLKNFTRIP